MVFKLTVSVLLWDLEKVVTLIGYSFVVVVCLFCFFEAGFFCVVLAVLALAL